MLQAFRSKTLGNLFKLVVSGTLVTWVLTRWNLAEARSILGLVHWSVPAAGVFFLILSQLLGARRWQMVLALLDIRLGYLRCAKLTFRGFFASNFLPTTIGGDAVKVGTLAFEGHKITLLATSIMVDRLLNLVAIASLLPALFWLPQLPSARILLISLVLILFGGAVLLAAGHKIVQSSKRLFRFFSEVWQSIGHIWSCSISHPRTLLWAAGLSWLSVLSGVLTTWIAALGLGIRTSFLEVVAVVAVFYFIGLVPVSINGLGVQDAGLIVMFSSLNVSDGQALALAILIRLLTVAVGLIGALELAMPRSVRYQ